MNHEAYNRAIAADQTWHAMLVARFGKRASDIRYTAEGKGAPGSTLRAAHDEFRAASDAWIVAMRAAA